VTGTGTTRARPRVLIEDWLPVAELGIESRRERAVVTTLPPLNWLHVWWARRPLVASAAVVLAGVLPAWTPELAGRYPEAPQLADQRAYHKWLLHLVGIWGDPITARRAYDAAVASGQRIPNPYTYRQAYRNAIPREDIDLLHQVLLDTWGELPLVADPTAGGGSIPFTATRLGLPAYANDLNGVAASVLRAGVQIPARHGGTLTPHLERWGKELVGRVQARLKPYFPLQGGESVIAYIWANAVACPRTGRLVPLMTDMWLRKEKGKEAAVRLVTERDGVPLDEPEFEVLTGKNVDTKAASAGTVARGKGTSPYDGLVIDGDYIKAEAQAGRMRQVLYAVAIRNARGEREFRAPTSADLDALREAQEQLVSLRAAWEAGAMLPVESFPEGNDLRPRHYGMADWADFFTPRQLLVHGTFSEEFARLIPEVREELGERADDVLFLLALMQGKALNYNSRLSFWHAIRQSMANTFDRHDFAFKWTFAEFEGATALYAWCLDQLMAAYSGIGSLLHETGRAAFDSEPPLGRSVTVTQGGAASLPGLPTGSVAHLCMDPPYYDNVMYAELADYFYVWEKRTLGRIVPEYFPDSLSDKGNEAVANPARFQSMGKRKGELADLDYEAKMTAIFAECRRVLRDDGVMSVMFTHKASGAWDALASGLVEAGFVITASWPVNTESEISMHIKEKSAAKSTIFLVCRPQEQRTGDDANYWEDVEPKVAAVVRERVQEFQDAGIGGVDLYLACFGPALQVFSEHWPLKRGRPARQPKDVKLAAGEEWDPYAVRPEDALDAARREVKQWRLSKLASMQRQHHLDPLTEWYVLAWDAFKALRFPGDEALKLARVVGLDFDKQVKNVVCEAKGSDVILWDSKTRKSKGKLGPVGEDVMLDTLHHCALAGREQNTGAAKTILEKAGLLEDPTLLVALEALLNVLPPPGTAATGKKKEAGVGGAASDCDALEKLRRLAFADEIPEPQYQKLLFVGADGGDDDEETDEE